MACCFLPRCCMSLFSVIKSSSGFRRFSHAVVMVYCGRNPKPLWVPRQRIPGENPCFDRLTLDEMFLNEARDAVGSHAAVPGSFGINEHGGSVAADAQATDFGAITS